MDNLMIKAEIKESEEATRAQFQEGLNRDIQDRLEMQEYDFIGEILHKATLIEQQNKRRGVGWTQFGSASKSTYTKEDRQFTKPKEDCHPIYAALL